MTMCRLVALAVAVAGLPDAACDAVAGEQDSLLQRRDHFLLQMSDGLQLRHGVQKPEIRKICHVRHAHDDPSDGADVTVLLNTTSNARYLLFGDDTIEEAETEIHCTGRPGPGDCLDVGHRAVTTVGACPNCPCAGVHVTKKERRDWWYFNEMLNAVEHSCGSTSGPYRVLIIGNGGGALASEIVSSCSNAQVDGVEYDERVVELSNKFFGMGQKRVTAHHADALEAVKKLFKLQTFDAVLIDCFSTKYGTTPASCSNDAFVHGVKAILRPNTGFVAHHLWTSDARWPKLEQQVKAIQRLYSNAYGTVMRVNNRDNDLAVLYGAITPAFLRGGLPAPV